MKTMLKQPDSRSGAGSALADSKKAKWRPAFVICKSCYWCASELTSSIERCPSCFGVLYREELNTEAINCNV